MMRTPSPARERGALTIETLIGMTIGTILTAGLLLFWVNSSQESGNHAKRATQESSAVLAMTSIGRDIQNSSTVLYAATNELVLETRNVDGTATRTRYAQITDSGKKVLTRQVITSATSDYDYDAPGWAAPAQAKIVSDIKVVSGEPTYRYFTKTGTELPAGTPLLGNGAAKNIARVDIHVQASAGKAHSELRSSAAVNSKGGDGGAVDAAIPACPAVSIAKNTAGQPVLSWERTAGTNSFRIVRNGASPALAVLGKTATSWTDTNPLGNGIQTTYQVIPTGIAGSPGSCTNVIWAPKPDDPHVRGSSAPHTTPMLIDWDAVDNATGYTLQYRPASTTTFAGTGNWTTVTLGASTRNYTLTPAKGTAYEFRVYADAPTGRSEDPWTFTLLNRPDVPTNVRAAASFYSQNKIDWNPVNSANRYQVRRGDAGAITGKTVSSTVTGTTLSENLLGGSLFTNLNTSATASRANDTFLGHEYPYSVVAHNMGPRAFDSRNPTANTVADSNSGWSGWSNALQYPPDPKVTKAEGSEAAPDGTNRVTYEPARGASTHSLHSWWNDSTGGALPAYTMLNLNPSQTVIAETNVPRGSRKVYAVVAWNTTGASPARALGPAETRDAYQRPERPQPGHFWGAPQPTLSSLDFEINWNFGNGNWIEPYPEQGNREAGKAQANNANLFTFCGTVSGADCKYEVWRKDQHDAAYTKKADLAWNASNFTGTASDEGITDLVAVKACNAGGCSEKDTNFIPEQDARPIKSYPGTFAPSPVVIGWYDVSTYATENPANVQGVQVTARNPDSFSLAWKRVPSATQYRVNVTGAATGNVTLTPTDMAAPSATIESLSGGTAIGASKTYNVTVTALNASGGTVSAASSSVSVTTTPAGSKPQVPAYVPSMSAYLDGNGNPQFRAEDGKKVNSIFQWDIRYGQYADSWRWNVSTNQKTIVDNYRYPATMRMRWTGSNGHKVRYDVQRTTNHVSVPNDPTAVLGNYAWTTPVEQTFDQRLNSSSAAPYAYQVTAVADNGLARGWTVPRWDGKVRMMTPPQNNAWYRSNATCLYQKSGSWWVHAAQNQWGSNLYGAGYANDDVSTPSQPVPLGRYSRDLDRMIYLSQSGRFPTTATTEAAKTEYGRSRIWAASKKETPYVTEADGRRMLLAAHRIGTAPNNAGVDGDVWGSEVVAVSTDARNYVMHYTQNFVDNTGQVDYGNFWSKSKWNTDSKTSNGAMQGCTRKNDADYAAANTMGWSGWLETTRMDYIAGWDEPATPFVTPDVSSDPGEETGQND